jgi:CO dehydrogenase maturation factor
VVGKGGVGKTTIAGTLARLLARSGRNVLAVDFDPNPGLTYSLGMSPSDEGLPLEAIEEAPPDVPYGWQLAAGLDATDAVLRFARRGPDGIRFLTPGKIDAPKHNVGRSVSAVRQILDRFRPPDWDVIGDIDAGPSSPFETYHRFADRVLVVITPGWTSQLTARRLQPIVAPVPIQTVQNRWHPGASSEIAGGEMETALTIPEDRAVRDADRLGLALIDYSPATPAVRAIESLAERLSVISEVPV